MSDVTEEATSPVRCLDRARSHLDAAAEERSILFECWQTLCESGAFDSAIVLGGGSHGRLDVSVQWPAATWLRANEAARGFAASVRGAFDAAILGSASAVPGLIRPPDPEDHRMLLTESPQQFQEQVRDGALRGLRPEQVRLIEQFQLYSLQSDVQSDAVTELIRPVMGHLARMVSAARVPDRSRVAVWAHSASPAIDVGPHGVLERCVVIGDGLLESQRTVAKFVCRGACASDIWGNPNIAFDLIFNDEPYPADPDDNLQARSALLLAVGREFIRVMEHSLASSPLHGWSLRYRREPGHASRETPWGTLATESSAQEHDVASALAQSDLGMAVHYDESGNMTMLLRAGDQTFARPIPPALPLDPGSQRGPAAEDASLTAASIWGLPDFVMRAAVVDKGSGRREVGDGTIIAGDRGLLVQVKSRHADTGQPSREASWLQKNVFKGARQARGTWRMVRSRDVDLVNGRGRTIRCRGSEIDWVGVVIIDHPDAPELVVDTSDLADDFAIVTVLRRDWDFLFDQLRSVSAVVDYIHRVATDEPRPLGDEALRYYELARADDDAASESPASWTAKLDSTPFTRPILPVAPAKSGDTTGHTVFRVILEDIALTDIDHDEGDRLTMLSHLDRFSVADRAELGRVLLDRLEDVVRQPPDSTKWHFRRVVQDAGTLHLAFGVCSQFSELHREAFSQWAMLRHHDFTTAGLTDATDRLTTVAVLLTPRHDGARPWDTSTVAIQGLLTFTPEELASLRRLWPNQNAAQTE